jgi:hypothetical protein
MQTIPASPQTKRQGGYTIIELSHCPDHHRGFDRRRLGGGEPLLNSSKANSQIEDSGIVLAKLQSTPDQHPSVWHHHRIANGMGSRFLRKPSWLPTSVTNCHGGGQRVCEPATVVRRCQMQEGDNPGLATCGRHLHPHQYPEAVCADIASSLASFPNAAYGFIAARNTH